MHILVTGGAGYIGSHVVRSLQDRGHRVTILDDLSSGHKEAVKGDFIVGDMGDERLLEEIFSAHSYQGVIHFAAFCLVGESMENPEKYFANNICNSLNLVKAMVKHKVRHLVFSSSAAVYGEPIEVPILEDHPTHPTNTYGETKLALERFLRWFDEAHELKSISLRYFNASGAHPSGDIGEDHNPETHLIPIILEKALGQRDSLSIYGEDYPTKDGTCVRDYIHVCDLATAHILALEALVEGRGSGIYNLGNGLGYSVKEVIEMAQEVVGEEILFTRGERRAGDPAALVASSEKIKEELGWRPEYCDLKTIIETAWRWHKGGGFK